MKIEEEFISGFCRTCNMGQTVCCEYTIQDNEKTLSFMDCAHERCVNTGACEIYRQIMLLTPMPCPSFAETGIPSTNSGIFATGFSTWSIRCFFF